MKPGDRVRVKYATFADTEYQVGQVGTVLEMRVNTIFLDFCAPSSSILQRGMRDSILVSTETCGPIGPGGAAWHRPEALEVVPDVMPDVKVGTGTAISGVLSGDDIREEVDNTISLLKYPFHNTRCVLPHPSEKQESKYAVIIVRHIDVKGVPCVEILGFENILMEHELPKEYFKGRLHFDLRKSTGSFTYRSTFNGLEYQDRVATEGTPFIALYIPEPIKGFNYPHGLYIYQGDILRQDTFDTVVVWLKRAGARLAKINRKKREAEEARKQKPKEEWVRI
jgi:hypothetical protein